ATGAAHAVVVSSGTAALHAAMFALGIGPGDEVIVPPITFAASANAVVYQGGTPIFADVDPRTLLIDPDAAAKLMTPRTRAILAVDYGGQRCEYDRLRAIAGRAPGRSPVRIVADACHSIGARNDDGGRVGTLADLSVFSFHPVKHVSTGEGGGVVTGDEALASRMRSFRNHGITVDHRDRGARGSWVYEIVELGYNYRLTDIQCALGCSQLAKLAAGIARRQAIAREYDAAFAQIPEITPLAVRPRVAHAFHLYVVCVDTSALACDRATFFSAM